jgi:peptidoglycan/LPS O-acetylase OafA/YrhL
MQTRRNALDSKDWSADAPPVVYALRPSRRRQALTPPRELILAAIWLLGLAGFLVPMLLARTGPHADLLRAGTMTWFLVFGLINGLVAFRAFPRRRIRRTRVLDR